MWEIFGALFGGAYILGRVANDKANKRAADTRFNRYLGVKNRLTNLEIESRMRNEMHWGKPYAMDKYRTSKAAIRKMESEIPKEDMEFVFGKDWERVFYAKEIPYIVYGASDYFHDIHEIAFNMWLASNKHLISTNHASGYSIGREVKGIPMEQRRYVPLRACQVIEKHIQEVCPDVSLWYPTSTLHTPGTYIEWNFSIASYDGGKGGRPW